ncbi:MAG: sterol desaturase family protein [Planctomycetaceae bacterium]|nr:sterol desaturase family protein [Planctomycetaceae bacterium]
MWDAVLVLLLAAVAFCFLAVLVKGKEALAAGLRAAKEIRVNLSLYFFDAVCVAPIIALLVAVVQRTVREFGLIVVSPERWESVGTWGIAFGAVFIGDFFSYWRHRLEHTRLLWPSHAIHHSDTQMTFLTLWRFHPINRATTAIIDIACLSAMGFPQWSITVVFAVRHYYGQFIHADVPWTYGPLKYLFVSPVMHRWHHARDVVGSGSNFATVFSVFDQAFGTYHMPGLCTEPLGVRDQMGQGSIGQLIYPFVAWPKRIFRRSRSDDRQQSGVT